MRVFPSERDDAQRAFGCVVVDLDGAIVEISRERSPSRERVADRSCHVALSGEVLKRPIEPPPKVFHDRSGSCLSGLEPDLGRGAAHLLFDGIELTDAADGLDRGG